MAFLYFKTFTLQSSNGRRWIRDKGWLQLEAGNVIKTDFHIWPIKMEIKLATGENSGYGKSKTLFG